MEELMTKSEEIASVIQSVTEEVNNLESALMKKLTLNRLIKENEELEELIEKYIKELKGLEVANGKQLVCPNSKLSSLENQVPDKVKNDTSVPLSESKVEISKKPNETKSHSKELQDNKSQKMKAGKQESENKKGSNKKGPVEDALPVDIGRLDLKVGKILEIKKHEDADSLYVEKVDIGKSEPITVVSGLVKHVPIEEMQNRLVIVMCNLKPVKMRGVLSEGMVMCASTPEKVEVLSPPTSSKPGDVITVPGYPPPPNGPEPVLNPKKKIFETVAPDLLTDSECFATYRGTKWEVAGGYVKSATLSGVNIK
ncbi:hypothetical protein O3M35_003194 [Rhynocoris fuscipes]|uniref:tRNA-binding domain-containing protein n=1 Tax=Rhynocoris fuscipes TaxID=488301 RepID=A0AAW1CM65_9HEMI